MNEQSEVQTKINQIIQFVNQGNSRDAMRILRELRREYPNNKGVIFNEPGILIESGGISKDIDIVKEGIEKGIALVEGGIPEEQKTDLHYNVANGHFALFNLEQHESLSDRLNNSHLQDAKHHFRQAMKLDPRSDLKVRILVNYGSFLDFLGRGVEALYCYDDVLNINPEYSMAIGNRALAKMFLANISGAFRAETYIEAYQEMKSVIDNDDLIAIGGRSANESFKRELTKIEGHFKDKSVLQQNLKGGKSKFKFTSDFEREYIEFCRRYKLFLNFHTGIHDDPDSILDSAFIRITTPVDDDTTFYSLSKKLNEIKEDFLVSKVLLVQSQFRRDDLNSISKKVAFVNTLDYANYNIYSALLKSAFRNCFNILDKIAFFINDYLGLNMKDSSISFHRIWEKEKTVKEEIRITNNISLFALYDIHLDLDSDKRLSKWRNSMTHRKLTVYESTLTGWDEKEDNENIGSETMLSETIKLMQLARSAIIYLMNFVEIEENKKRSELDGIVPQIFADTEQFL